MSTDYDVVCMTCKQKSHLGTDSYFGYGNKESAAEMAYLIATHLGHDLRIFSLEDAPDYRDPVLFILYDDGTPCFHDEQNIQRIMDARAYHCDQTICEDILADIIQAR